MISWICLSKSFSISFSEILKEITTIADGMTEMNNASIELADSSKQIMEGLGELINISSTVKNSSNQMDDKMQNILNAIKLTSTISGETKNRMIEAEHGITEIFKGINNVSEYVSTNVKNITELEELINKFKING